MRYNELLLDEPTCRYKPVTFGFENCKSGHSYGPAVRSYWLLHYVVSGKGKFEREGKTLKISKGDIFVIPPFLETYYEADANDPWTYVWIGFLAEDEISDCFLSPVLHCPEAERIFEEMKFCHHKDKGKNAYLVAKLWELISLLSTEGNQNTGYVEAAIQFMKNEYMNHVTVSDLAKRLGLNRSYFSNLFKEQIGTPPGKYLTGIRLNNAAELLTKHRMSPTTAALSCGYSDLYHFSKAFKGHFGISPRNYQKQYQKTEIL